MKKLIDCFEEGDLFIQDSSKNCVFIFVVEELSSADIVGDIKMQEII